ncbi:MAG: ABC transporter transmembrane domain-containing protein [Acidimicrobiia bacterium]
MSDTIAPAGGPGSTADAAAPWRLVLGLLGRHRAAVAGYGALSAAATALPLLGALLLARFVDLVAAGAGTGRLIPYAAAYAAIGALSAAIGVVVTWRTTSLAWTLTDELRRDLVRHVLEADLAFHRDRTPGELVTRVDADVTAMTQFLSRVMARVVAIVLLGIGAVLVLAFVEWRLAPPLAVGLALVAAATWWQRDSAMAPTVAERTAEAEVMSVGEQYLAAAEEVAALGAGSHGVRRLGERSTGLVDAVGRRVRVQMRVQAVIRIAVVVAEVLMLAVGALLLARGTIGVGAVFLGFRFVMVVRQPLEGLIWRLQEAQGATGAARRVLDLLAEWRAVPSGTATLPAGPLDVVFERATLVYDDEDGTAAALDGLELHLRAGRTVGVVGRTGSGKTSLARLVLRLVAPTSGSVRIGGVATTDIDEAALRARVAAVPQDVQLFPGSVADNVTLFAAVPDGEVIAALRAVGLGPWLDQLPDGIDTQLAAQEAGGAAAAAGLSAGEAQLLALARGLLRRPDVVVLDEATSRVDPHTQAAIAAATATLVAGRTAIIIAHRLETLEVCDDIAVMAGGRLVELGARTELAADPASRYARLLASAAGRERREAS